MDELTMTKRKPTLERVIASIHDKAASDEAVVRAYAEHVFAGNDPTMLPSGKPLRWSNSAAISFAHELVNAYRAEQGQEENPYAPFTDAYKLFDDLRADWQPAMYGERHYQQRVTSTINDRDLAPLSLVLVDKTEGGRKFYKIVKIAVDA